MKNLLIFILILLTGCTKEFSLEKTFGADPIGDPDGVQIVVSEVQGRRIKNPPPPPVDTVKVDTPVVVLPTTTLPTSWSLNMSYVIDQGSEGSCNAQNVTYARSYLAGVKLSPEFLFNLSKSTATCTGSALITNLNITRDSGICTWASMPYTWTGCSTLPNAQQKLEAQQYRIKSYSMVYANDAIAIKTLISQNKPLVFQVTADQSFVDAKPGFIWKTFTGAVAGHGITLVGYDDSKNAYKILNSWGTGWGDSGFSWIDYNFFTTVSSNLFTINL